MSAAHFTNSRIYHFRIATSEDIACVNWLDTFSSSPHRALHREVEKYFGSVDPSIHERNIIFFAELNDTVAAQLPFRAIAKAELLLAPSDVESDVGYIKRVVVHPEWRGLRVAQSLLEFIEAEAQNYHIKYLDLHVWDQNTSAIQLYERIGFHTRHRELYMRKTLQENEEDS